MITRLKKQRITNYVRGVVVSCGHLNVQKKEDNNNNSAMQFNDHLERFTTEKLMARQSGQPVNCNI